MTGLLPERLCRRSCYLWWMRVARMLFEPFWRRQVRRILESKTAFTRPNTRAVLHVVFGYLFMHAACAWQCFGAQQTAPGVPLRYIKNNSFQPNEYKDWKLVLMKISAFRVRRKARGYYSRPAPVDRGDWGRFRGI